MLNYAQADIATSDCVNCHNNHAASPKTNFRVGDLMGILAVQTFITDDPALAATVINPPKERAADKTAKHFEVSLKALSAGGITYSDLAMKNPVELPRALNQDIVDKLAEVELLWADMTASVDFPNPSASKASLPWGSVVN